MGKSSRRKKKREIESPPELRLKKYPGFLSPGPKGWLAASVIALLTLTLYLPALQNEFIHWDDNEYVTENVRIQSIDSDFFMWIFEFQASNWHPLTWVSHAIDYSIWGLNPSGHHLSSVIIHSSNTFLLCILIIYLILNTQSAVTIPNTEDRVLKRAVIAGGVTSLLFGIIPVHVESVAWVSERKDVLSTFFVLLSLVSYVRYIIRHGNKRRIYYISTLLFFIFALMSKPMAVTLPVVFLILDIYPFQRLTLKEGLISQKNVLTEKIPFFILSFVSAVLTIGAQQSGGAVGTLEKYPISSRIIVALKALFFYLSKILFPVRLSPYYPYSKDISFFSLEFFVPIAILMLITVFCLYKWKKGQMLFLAVWTYYLLTLLPVLGIVQVGTQAAADRYTYMPSIGPLLLIGLGVAAISERFKDNPHLLIRSSAIVSLPLMLFFIFMGMTTVKQITIWKNDITLWNSALGRFPDLPVAYLNRGAAYMLSGKYSEALKDLDNAIRFHPDYAKAYSNRAIVHIKLGNYQQAIEDLNKVLDPSPTNVSPPDLYYNRALAYTKLGNYQQTIADLNKFLALKPAADTSKTYMAYLERAAAHMKLGDYKQALQDSTQAIEMNTKEAKGYNYRATVYYAQGDLQKAIEDFSESIRINPNNYEFHGKRGTVYLKMGRKNEAIQDFQQAARLGDAKSQGFLNAQGIKW